MQNINRFGPISVVEKEKAVRQKRVTDAVAKAIAPDLVLLLLLLEKLGKNNLRKMF